MSEYQYYEFQAIDRPLDERAMGELRAITSRARITPTSLVNVYHFGDFKGDPERLMEKYFDAFLYVANWGTHRFMLRLPKRLFDRAAAEPYSVPDALAANATREHVILDFHSETEDAEDFEEGEAWLASLIPLRADLLAGDLRCLYLGWLAGVQSGEVDEDCEEPPVPPGLGKLSAPLRRFADFLRLDPDLIAVAAVASSGEVTAALPSEELAAWVAALPEAEKNQLLVRLIQGEAAHLGSELLQRYRRDRIPVTGRSGEAESPGPARRTVGSLLEVRDAHAEEQQREAAERNAQEQARQARERAAARARYLDSLAGREQELWRQVEAAIATKQAKEYDRALALLNDLRELGERSGAAEAFAGRTRQLREQHGGKWSLIRRLDQAGLPK
jgi:hypothetical protein